MAIAFFGAGRALCWSLVQFGFGARCRIPDRAPLKPNVGRLLLRSAISCLFLACALASHAAPATPTTTNSAPTNAAPAQPTFVVKAYQIEGNSLLPVEMIEKIFGDHVGPKLTFADISAALSEFQLAYRARGFVTVKVELPPQKLTNGIVRVLVTEGKLADVVVAGNRYYSEANIRRALPSLRTNVAINNLILAQELDAANSSRDRTIYPVLGPGPEDGTSTLTLKVKDRLPLHGRMELSNPSTPGTPELRVNSSMQYNNLWQLEHQLGVQYSFTPEKVKEDDRAPIYLDQPSIANYSAFYRIPLVSDAERERATRDYSIGDFGYDEVNKRFRAPAMSGRPELLFYGSRSDIDNGVKLGERKLITETAVAKFESQSSGQDKTVNGNLGARYIRPLRDMVGIKSSLSFGVDYKSYLLTSFSTNTFFTTFTTTNNGVPDVQTTTVPFAQPTMRQHIQYLPLSLSYDASIADKWGRTTFNFNNSFNVAGLLEGPDVIRRTTAVTNGSGQLTNVVTTTRATDHAGAYYTVNAGLMREQKLWSDWTARIRADGQWASQPLISNEQFGLGGQSGPRGYRDGSEYGDTGWRLMVEAGAPVLDIGMVDGTMPMLVRFTMFSDYGQRFLMNNPAGRPSVLDLWSAGFTVGATISERWEMRITTGWALLNTPTTQAGDMRMTFSVSLQY